MFIKFTMLVLMLGLSQLGESAHVRGLMDASNAASPTVGADGVIYMPTGGAYNSSVIAVNPDGTTKWKYTMLPVSDTFASSIMTVMSHVTLGNDDLLYVPSSDGNLYALDIHTGMAKWRFETYGNVLHDQYCVWFDDFVCPMVSNVLVHTDGTLYFKADASLYHASASGKLLWQTVLPDLVGDMCDSSLPWMSEQVELSDGVVYLHTKCHFFAIDADDGEIMWNQSASHYGDAPRIGKDGTLYALTRALFEDGSRLVAFNSTNISVMQSFSEGGGRRVMLEDDIIYVSTDKAVHAVYTNGTQKWNRSFFDGTAPSFLVSSPVSCGSMIYVTMTDVDDSGPSFGQLRALDKETGDEKWTVTPNFSSPFFDCTKCSGAFDPCGLFCYAQSGTEPACGDHGTIYFGVTNLFMPSWMLWAAASPNGTLLWTYSDWDSETSALV